MSFYTQLIFNCVNVPRDNVFRLRDSARAAFADEKCPWAYILENVYLESVEEQIIDLGLSTAMTEELTSQFGDDVVPVDKFDFDEDDEVCYTVKWLPLDGPSGKWYEAEGFARWLAAFCGFGQIYQMSDEESGGLWGWTFEDGQICELELSYKGEWKAATPLGDYGEQADEQADEEDDEEDE